MVPITTKIPTSTPSHPPYKGQFFLTLNTQLSRAEEHQHLNPPRPSTLNSHTATIAWDTAEETYLEYIPNRTDQRKTGPHLLIPHLHPLTSLLFSFVSSTVPCRRKGLRRGRGPLSVAEQLKEHAQSAQSLAPK